MPMLQIARPKDKIYSKQKRSMSNLYDASEIPILHRNEPQYKNRCSTEQMRGNYNHGKTSRMPFL